MDNDTIIIEPGMLKGTVSVPDDIYAYAMFLMAGAIGNDIVCKPVKAAQSKVIVSLIDIITMAGGIVKESNGGISARMSGVMKGIDVNLKNAEDILCAVAAFCAFLKGESRIYGIDGVKNQELLKEISSEFNHLGIYTEITADGLFIKGCQVIKSDGAYTWKNAKLALALMIMSCRAEGEVCISGVKSTEGIDAYFRYYKQLKERM